MSKFTKEIIVKLENDGTHWRIVEPFTYYTDITPERHYIHVPEGFRTDFASIPKIFLALPFITYKDKFNKAAVIHDLLYRIQYFDRKTSDKIFLEGMLVLQIPPWKAYIFYVAVRIFAVYAWWSQRRKIKKYGLPYDPQKLITKSSPPEGEDWD